MLFKRPSFYLALAGLAGMVVMMQKSTQTPPAPPPFVTPARSPYASSVAATGIIEARRENVRLAVPRGGLIQKLFVKVGSPVKAGDPVLQLDNRESRARLDTARAQVDVLRAALAVDQVMVADARDQFERVEKLAQQAVASEDERKRKEFQMKSWEARVARLNADLKAAEAQVAQAQTELDVLTVRAPRDGTVLQVNAREGEFAGTMPAEPILVLGDVDTFQVRTDVDEQNAPLVQPNRPAVAFLKGSTQHPMPLRFVRIEPFVIPKKSLTGDSTERVDTRVLQIIFELDRPDQPLYVGQQVDVFIERATSPRAEAAPAPSTSPSP